MDRQYSGMPYWPPGQSRYPPVKDEPDYSKMGYEDAPGGAFGGTAIKSEPGTGFNEPPPVGYGANVKVEAPFTDVKQELVEPKQEPPEDRRGEKRQALNQYGSPEPKRYRLDEKEHTEDEPEYDKNAVILDWYNSDLSLMINKETFLSAEPLTSQGFGYVWHGVRATYGFLRGRVFFEVKVEDHLPVPQLEEEELHPHVMRMGWSIDDAGMTLGEEPFSYGYGGTGKASCNLKFKDYGRTFGKGDVVSCFLDMDSEPIVISFSVNGRNLGMCYEVPHRSLQGKALFPHILTKNCSFKVNFGSEYAWFQPLTRYTFVGQVPLQERELGSQGPATRQDSEIIMMVGLPACGKTTWVEKHCKENLSKKYYVMGTNFLIDKMKVNGLPRKRNYHGRWDVLIDRCTKCLNKLLEMSYKRRRNFIIDQTNVYPSARRRKMKGFPGFFRKAVVVVPSDEEFKRRTDKQIGVEGKNVPDSAILEMKANFTVPEVEDDLFDAVEFTDLSREEATKLVDQYSKDAQSAGYVKKGGFRGRGGGGNFRGGWNRDRRGGGFNDRQDRSSSSGDQDNRNSNNNRGGYSRDSFGGNNRDSSSNRGNREFSRFSDNSNRGSDNSRGGFGRESWGGDNNRGFGRGDNNRGGFGRGGDSSRGGFGRGGDSSRGGFGRGSFGNSRDGPRDRDNDNRYGSYNRNSQGGNDRGYEADRSSRDLSRGDDISRGGFSTESFGGSRGFAGNRGFGQDGFSGNRDMQRGFDNGRDGFSTESFGGGRDMQRGFNMDRDNRGSDSSRGSYNRDLYSGNNRDIDRGYNVDNRNNTTSGSDARGGFNRDAQRGMDREYGRGGSDSYGGFNSGGRGFNMDRERDSRSEGDSRGSYGGNNRDMQRGGYGSYDNSSKDMGNSRGGSHSNQDHTDSSGYSSMSSSMSSSLSNSSSSIASPPSYGNNWNRQYGQQQSWGQSDGYGSQLSSGSSQPSYGRSADRSSSPSVGTGTGTAAGGVGAGAGAGAAAAGTAAAGGGGWGQQGSGGWGQQGSGSGPGNPQWNYGSSYQGGQRQ